MLLNLSNHPYGTWQAAQRAEAERRYGTVTDFPFPAVDPMLSGDAVAALAESVVEKVLQSPPNAIHVMGKMTLTFVLVARFQAAGLTCLASTSERLVVESEDGKKNRDFSICPISGISITIYIDLILIRTTFYRLSNC
ncbi:MAG: CRISPR-associated protein [Bacteroidetes Order II. Incertae sedis bacterium]|nr:CRISPR-associated protein [Bacteroidetes Order II. bacterium]